MTTLNFSGSGSSGDTRVGVVALCITAALTAHAQIRIPNGSAGKAGPLTADVTVVTSSHTRTGSFSQTESGKFWRASDGKTRQDNAAGSLIHDPNTGLTIHVNHAERSATLIQRAARPRPVVTSPGKSTPSAPPPATIQTKSGQIVEALGEREFGGIAAKGTRVTIPHLGGRLGTTTVETWTAPDLGLALVLKETRIDGTTEQHYENVQLGEPPPDVFQIPSGYTVRTAATRKADPPPGAVSRP